MQFEFTDLHGYWKTRQILWDSLQDYRRIEWKQTLRDVEKTPDMTYDDILNNLDLTWGGGGGQRSYCDPQQLSSYLEGYHRSLAAWALFCLVIN